MKKLEQIRDIESGAEYLNKVKGIEAWAKAEKKDAELQNIIAEQKIRTQRILGRLLKENSVSKNFKSNLPNIKNSTVGQDTRPTDKKLSDYGISKYESSTFQTIASNLQNLVSDTLVETLSPFKSRIMR